MASRCRAVVFSGKGTHEIREFPVPDPPPDGAILRVEAVGLCGSDLAQYQGVEHVPGASAFPVVPGHEIVGRVDRLGPDADLGVAEGDRVAVNEVLTAAPPFYVYGYSSPVTDDDGLYGGYGEYMVIRAGTQLFKLSGRVPPEEATFFEPLANAINWVETVGIEAGETVVVEGPGHQGLAVLEAVRAADAGTVIVTGAGGDGLRLEAARALGASHIIDVDAEDPDERVGERTRGH